jgi:hypothetical protein
MKLRFEIAPTISATELRLLDGQAAIPLSAWGLSGHPGADICQRLILEDQAIEDEACLLVEHPAMARMTADEARKLDLPPATALRAVVEGNGIMLRPDFAVALRWVRPTGQAVLGVQRVGAWLQEAEGWRRLPETLFAVAEAVDGHAVAARGDEADRMRAIARLREALPPAATSGQADASGMLGTVTVIEADAFSLDTVGEGDAMHLVPVLHRAGGGTAPLLPEDRQRMFGAEQFLRFASARPVYSLPGGVYITISPLLRRALEVVRRAAAGTPTQRRALLRDPRPAIREALGDEADLALIDSVVVETPIWSERVIGLGLWQPRVVPWIVLPGNDWFGDGGERGQSQQARVVGLLIGDRGLELTVAEADALATAVTVAMAHGEKNVIHVQGEEPIQIPATPATLAALATSRIPGEVLGFSDKPQQPLAPPSAPPPSITLTPIIEDNFVKIDIEAIVRGRAAPPRDLPACLAAQLKPHQAEGLDWLQRSWIAGSPGVLLADDMGLGKTLQGLAFLAWLREGMPKSIPKQPLLIVAPTGLLENWRAEHDRHLTQPGLGRLLTAYGRGLAALRKPNQDGEPGLDLSAIRAADWVLTTYETLRDYSRDFAAVRFATMLMDEAQKVKTPGIRMTDAAKAMNADFRVALTGTPVENRLADLWCIVDGVAPGHLGDLRRFSATYEGPEASARLIELKASLDQSLGGRPALLKRRLKEDRLPELPACTPIVARAAMQGMQLEAYQQAVACAREDSGAGRVLEALHRLRQVSLCPAVSDDIDDATLISSSVRLKLAIDALDQIQARGERALLFLDNLALMARLAGLLQRRYRLSNVPMTINGSVAGAARQARVDRFQSAADGFDVMLLSPRAGGVGLTLTRANHVIHLARWWNPAVEDQSTARVHRIGQTKPVTVHLPLAVLNDGRRSFDENLHALLERKRLLMRDALLPPEFDKGELASMLDESLRDGTI